jgi:hypothetical protein
MKKYLIIIVLFITFSNNHVIAQDASSFEGTYYSANEKLIIKAIKITDTGDGELLVQFKTSKGIEKHKVNIPKNNTFTVTVLEEESFGRYKIMNGKIITASGGSHGEATEIYYENSVATREMEYISYRLTLIDGNIRMEYRFFSNYLDNNNRLLFDQSSNWGVAGEYTSW